MVTDKMLYNKLEFLKVYHRNLKLFSRKIFKSKIKTRSLIGQISVGNKEKK